MKYLLLGYTAAQEWDESDVSAEEIARVCREYDALEQRLRDIGEFVAAEGLADHSQTVTVSSRDGVAVATENDILAIGEGVRSYVMETFSQFGTNIMSISPGHAVTGGMGGLLNTVRPLTTEVTRMQRPDYSKNN